MAKDVKIRITAQNEVKAPVSRAKAALTGLKKTASSVASGIASAFRLVVKGLAGVAAGAALLGVAVKKAFQFESYTVQFKVLFGNLEKAKERIKDLQDFSASTPFQFGELAAASRSLEVFTGGVLGATDSLRLVGDAAAAVGQPVKDVSFWVGRAYSAIASGRPFGEAAARLQEMGILSGEARGKIEDLTAAGASNAEIWDVVQGGLEGFEGGMEDMSQTGDGLISTLKDNWSLAVAKFGEAFMKVAKDDISLLIEWIGRLRTDGTLEKWAANTLSVINKVGAGIRKTATFFKEFTAFIKGDFTAQNQKELKRLQDGIAYINAGTGLKKKQAEEQSALDAVAAKEQAELDMNARIAKDMEEKQKAANQKVTDKLEKERSKLEEKIAKKKADAEMAEVKRAINADRDKIRNDIAFIRPDAERGVKGWIAKFKQDKVSADQQAEEDKREKKLLAKERKTGLKLTKKDQEWLDNLRKAREAKDAAELKLNDLRNKDLVLQEQLKKLSEDRNLSLKKMETNLDGINKKLAPLLAMK